MFYLNTRSWMTTTRKQLFEHGDLSRSTERLLNHHDLVLAREMAMLPTIAERSACLTQHVDSELVRAAVRRKPHYSGGQKAGQDYQLRTTDAEMPVIELVGNGGAFTPDRAAEVRPEWHPPLRRLERLIDDRDRLELRRRLFPETYVHDAVGRPFVRVMRRAV